MTNLMNEMIREAANRINEKGYGYAFEHRETKIGDVVLYAQIVNSGTKNNQFRKDWTLNGKRISAAKLLTM